MVILPGRYQWNKFKDFVHFYTLLGAIPIAIGITLINVFIGPATLEEIPDDYVPKEWEYHEVRFWILGARKLKSRYWNTWTVGKYTFVTNINASLFQHPIKRFLQRYCVPSPQQEYEKYMHYIYHENEVRKVRKLEAQVEDAMAANHDYRSSNYFQEIYGSKYMYKYKDLNEKLPPMDRIDF